MFFKHLPGEIFILLLSLLISCNKPTRQMSVVTGNASNLTTVSAELKGTVIDIGESPVMYGHCYGVVQNVNINSSKSELGIPSATGDYSSQLTGLIPETKYYYRAYLRNATETVYGTENFFTTSTAFLPALTTTTISLITSSSAVSGGNITNDGGVQIIDRGVCWHPGNEITSPDLSDPHTTDGQGAGEYTSNITGLQPGREYKVRAYATNWKGISYGNDLLFMTNSTVPVIKTGTLTEITASSAKCSGQVLSEGGENVTDRGICWSTSPGPTMADNIISDGGGLGTFLCSLSILNPNTKYYVRAYAVNIVGTAYGSELTFKTYTGTVTDYDGNIYNTITIGTQIWTHENLKVTHYRNGDPIDLITDGMTWLNATSGTYCWYGNNLSNKAVFGALYNFSAVENPHGLCPTGWHVATETNWNTLVSTVGQLNNAGGMLKDTTLWISPNTGADNSSGFTALPGGCRGWEDGRFDKITEYGYWWTSTLSGNSLPVISLLRYNYGGITFYENIRRDGFSVRCIKD